MNLWTELTAAALLGTGRGFQPIPLPGQLNELLTEMTAEERLLQTAGILAVAQMAGLTALPSTEPVPALAAPETGAPVAEPEDVAVLARILEAGQTPLVAEACQLLARNGRCLPACLLPRALELGRQLTALREPLRPALGPRGAWLAAQNPDWNFAVLASVEPDEQRVWEEGDVRQRAAWLRRLRTTDPARARGLLESAFASETARDRALLLPALGENLGPDDEPFLAATLANDRGKEVRALAAALLSRLPASAFAGRMTARLAALLRSERQRLRTVTVIEPPECFAPDWKADALEQAPPARAKLGERAWWLEQLVGFAPLPWWEEQLALDPEGILAWAKKSEWKTALLTGFRTALGRQPGQPAWIGALLKCGGFAHQDAVELALTLAPAEADAALQQILAETDDAGLAAQVIESADFAWSEGLWQAAQQKLPRWLGQRDWRFQAALPRLAYRIPPAALIELPALPDASPMAEAIARFAAIVDQRRVLQERFKR